MRRFLLAATAALAMFGTVQAQGGVPEGAFVRDETGAIFLVHGGERHQVPIFPATSEQLAAIPTSGRWLVPLADGSIVPGDRPEWDQPNIQPPPTQRQDGSGQDDRITFEGRQDKNTDPFWLSGGNYRVRSSATPRAGSSIGCFHSVGLAPVTPGGRSFLGGPGSVEGGETVTAETNVYNVPSGNYYVKVISGCSRWKVTIEPLR